jgi:hypothetical protein
VNNQAAHELRVLMDRENPDSRDHEILEATLQRVEAGLRVPHDLIMQTQRIMNKGNNQNRYGK